MRTAATSHDRPVANCPKCGAAIGAEHPYTWCIACGEQLPSGILAALPVVQATQAAGSAAESEAALAARASAAADAGRGPSARGGIIIVIACCAIFAFILFVPTRPGHSSSKGFLAAIALFWMGRGIVQIAGAKAWSKRHTRRKA
jgi:hypothetical protein